MSTEQLTMILAAIPATIAALTALIVSVFSGMATRRQHAESEAKNKAEREAAAKEIELKLAASQKKQVDQLEAIEHTFNSKMDAFIAEVRKASFAAGEKSEKERADIITAAAEKLFEDEKLPNTKS